MTRFVVTYRKESFVVEPRREFAIEGRVPWCVMVDQAWYQVATTEINARRGARDFLHIGIRSALSPRTPNFLASLRYPLLLSIDGVAIRGWPMTVDASRSPVWLFESAGRPSSECGTITAEQTLADVADLAKLWLRTAEDPD